MIRGATAAARLQRLDGMLTRAGLAVLSVQRPLGGLLAVIEATPVQ